MSAPARVVWCAQPGPQQALVSCPVKDILFGGARGGGKTDGLLLDYLTHANRYGKYARGILFRRSIPEFEEIIGRTQEMFPRLSGGWKYEKARRTWRARSGAFLRLRYLEDDRDATRYQGHSYCVAVGTPIRMADGTFKPIESIRIGEMVATLEGPRRVTDRVAPYAAECVRARVTLRGRVIGEQVHPVWHPVLSTAGLLSAGYGRGFPASAASPGTAHADAATRGPSSRVHRDDWGWRAWSEDRQSGYTASSHSLRGTPPLDALSFPAALHAPTAASAWLRSVCADREPSGSRSLRRWLARLLGSRRATRRLPSGLRRRFARVLSALGLDGRGAPNAHACVRSATGAERDSPGGCPTAAGCHGGPAPAVAGTALGHTRRSGGVERPSRCGCADASGTIPTRTHPRPGRYTHPYTGEARCLSERVLEGQVELQPCGVRLVCDLTVEHANHYITSSGLVNKNTWLGVDEMGNFPIADTIDKLRATLRSARGVPCVFRASANPGGVGHNWIRARYLDIAPPFTPFLDGRTIRIYIPARFHDNPALAVNDPGYWDRIAEAVGDNPALLRAWREGDWDIVSGGFFDDVWKTAVHVVRPFQIPRTWYINRSFDWGDSSPFSVGWWAESDGCEVRWPEGGSRIFPRGSLFRIAELYGCQKDTDGRSKPNTGVRWTASEISAAVLAHEQTMGWDIQPSVADASIFTAENAHCIAKDFENAGCTWHEKSDSSPGSRKNGWASMRRMLKASLKTPMEQPGLFVFDECRDFIRTVPYLPRDPRKLDDVNTKAEDHIADETRYRIMQVRHETRIGMTSGY